MINNFKEKFLTQDEMYLDKKKVKITKLTPKKWKQLFDTVDRLPGLVIKVITARPQDFYVTVLQAFDIALDEIVKVVSILTGIEEEYILNHVGINELIEYVTRVVELNRLDNTVKNVVSLLPKKK